MPPTKTITKPGRKLPNFAAAAAAVRAAAARAQKDPRDGRPLADSDRVAVLGLDRSGDRSKPFYYVYTLSDLPEGVQALLKELTYSDMYTDSLHRMQDGSLHIDPVLVGTWDLRFDSWDQDQMFDMTSCDTDFPEGIQDAYEKHKEGAGITLGQREELQEYVAEWEERMRSDLKELMLNDLKDFFYDIEAPDPVDKPWESAKGIAITITYDPQDW